MKIPLPKIRIRSLVILIAIGAVGLALARDRPNRQIRNNYRESAAFNQRFADLSARERDKARIRIGTPYPRVERSEKFGLNMSEWMSFRVFRDWESEAEYWTRSVGECRRKAAEAEVQSEIYRRRLAFPWF